MRIFLDNIIHGSKHVTCIAKPSPARALVPRKTSTSRHGFPDDPFRTVREDIRDAQANYKRIESLLRRACRAMGNCKPENLLREIEVLKTQPHLKEEKDQLEIRMTAVSAEFAVKTKKVR